MCSLSLESATPGKYTRSSQCDFFLNPPLWGEMRLNYQDPNAGVLSFSGYGVRGIYIHIAIIVYINKKDILFLIRSGNSATVRGVYGRS